MHINEEGRKLGLDPLTQGGKHTTVMKTEGLKQALDKHASTRRSAAHAGDEEKKPGQGAGVLVPRQVPPLGPKESAPELWNLYNTKVNQGESIRVFPLSNWTELDVWQYIHLENIPIVPLYFSAKRPVVRRKMKGAETLVMVDDDRLKLEPGEEPEMKNGSLPHARLLPTDRRLVRARRRRYRKSSKRCCSQRPPNAKAAASTTTKKAAWKTRRRKDISEL